MSSGAVGGDPRRGWHAAPPGGRGSPRKLAQRECGDFVGRADRQLLAWLQRRELERVQNWKWGSVFPSMGNVLLDPGRCELPV